MMATVTFNGVECRIVMSKYLSTDNASIQLIDLTDGTPYAMATVNTGNTLPSGMVAIKNYSENEGVLEALLQAGVIEWRGDTANQGYTKLHLCYLVQDSTESASDE